MSDIFMLLHPVQICIFYIFTKKFMALIVCLKEVCHVCEAKKIYNITAEN